ncbi:MAG: diguanylate cyclase [Rhodanobacteraceae bacterium]
MSINPLPTHDVMIADEARRIVECSHGLRTLGLSLGAFMVGTVLYRHGAHWPVWVLLALYGFVWPHLAWLAVRRSSRPVASDQRWLLIDTAMGGVWIALMQFNLLPSVLLAAMFAMTLVALGGARFLSRGVAVQVVACCLTTLANGLAFAPTTGIAELLASIPLLVVFPMTLSVIMYRLAQRVRRQNRVLLEMSSVDCLSGLLNRRHWEEAVNAVLSSRRGDRAVMLLVDIDHLKHINDQHGHTAGDEVIRMVGMNIREKLRDGDLAGRYGGDEFGLVLRDADMRVAELVAERIRSGVACTLVKHVPGLHCTLSIGVAPGRADLSDAREWVKDADPPLYSAKLAGRNRFVVAN